MDDLYIVLAILLLGVLPVVSAAAGFPFGVFHALFGRQKTHRFPIEREPFCFDFSAAAAETGRAYTKTPVFLRAEDGTPLRAEYHGTGSRRAAVLIHGYRSNPRRDFEVIAEDLFRHGFDLLVCFQRGHGVSGGRFGGAILESRDVPVWIRYVDEHTPAKDVLVWGVSMGGATVAYAAGRIDCPKVRVLVVDSAFTSYRDVMAAGGAEKSFFTRVAIRSCCVLARRFRRVDITQKVKNSLQSNRIPTAFLYGMQDDTVPLSQIEENYEANASPKTLILDEHAAHAKAFVTGEARVKTEFYRFVSQYIPEPDGSHPNAPAAAGINEKEKEA